MKRLVRRALLAVVRWLEIPGEAYLTGSYRTRGHSTVFPARHAGMVEVAQGVALHGAFFNVWAPVRIEDGVVLGHDVAFLTGNHDAKDGVTDRAAGARGAITIRRGAWLASRAVVLGGVTVGAGARIGAGAVVTRDVPDGEFWAGVPARRVETTGRTEA